MVKWLTLPLALLLAGGAEAQTAPDWRLAGGELFVDRPHAAPATDTPPDSSAAPARLAPPPQPYAAAVEAAAARHGIDPKLLHALVAVESAYRPQAVSDAGAAGLTQLMPETAAALGVGDRFDPRANLLGGADYLARQLLRFGDLRLALAAYNAGPNRVARLGHVPDKAETRAYVDTVVDCYLALSAGRAVRSATQCQTGKVLP